MRNKNIPYYHEKQEYFLILKRTTTKELTKQ